LVPDSTLLDAGALLLLVGLGIGAVTDVRTREVPEWLWVVLTLAGSALGGIAIFPGGWVPMVFWIVGAAFVFEHLLPWDETFDGEWPAYVVEVAIYLGVLILFGVGIFERGVGPNGVPASSVAVVVTVLFARALFEAGILFGGADAKAVMVAGILVPFFPNPWWVVPRGILPITSVLPYAVDLLMDAALLSVVVPIALAIVNLRRREFRGADGFTTYTIPVSQLPERFVWVRDPQYPVDRESEGEIATSEGDREWRVRIAGELRARGIHRVRVGPQLPFIVLLFAGAIAALAFGNLVFDVLVLL
jgi:prepilin signal peptidase PulO-like enzyme (type II secretory pathway)